MDMTIIFILFLAANVAISIMGIGCIVNIHSMRKKIAAITFDKKRDKSPVINTSPVVLGVNASSIIIANAIKESLERVAKIGGAT